jgi:4-diphosphocytidyl-2-C-methyl-D-erythritol kinase
MTRRPRRVVIEARAKLNLGLAVGPRRRDGFHELCTVFQSISLADTLVATPRRRGFTLRVRHAQAAARGPLDRALCARVPRGGSNLVLRAARALAARCRLRTGAHFTLVKRIPAQAGLGGGSADAAAALVALARLQRPEPRSGVLFEVARHLGADVTFALRGGTALGTGRGDVLRPLRLARPFRAVVAVPEWGVDTAAAYARWDRVKNGLTHWKRKLRFAERVGRTRVTVSGALRLGNTFEHVLGVRRAEFDALRRRMRAAGLLRPHLTGSGSAVFALVAPGVRVTQVVDRFVGGERLFVVRSTGRGLRSAGQATAGRFARRPDPPTGRGAM